MQRERVRIVVRVWGVVRVCVHEEAFELVGARTGWGHGVCPRAAAAARVVVCVLVGRVVGEGDAGAGTQAGEAGGEGRVEAECVSVCGAGVWAAGDEEVDVEAVLGAVSRRGEAFVLL